MNKIVSGYTFGTQYSNTTRTSLCLKLMTTWLFVEQLVQVPGYKLTLMEHHFLSSPVPGESNIKPFPCHGVILWWKCIFTGPSMVGAEETCDYHIYGITQNWPDPWWRHQMETFSALLALCMGNSPVTGEFPSQWLVARNFQIFFNFYFLFQIYLYRVKSIQYKNCSSMGPCHTTTTYTLTVTHTHSHDICIH